MKKILMMLLPALFLLAGCKYDDSSLREQIDDHESRITELEKLCNTLNSEIGQIRSLVESLQKNDFVSGITGSATSGYTISFTSGKVITIKNGSDGSDGTTPVVAVKQDTDGEYYWTINGQWLRDAAGNKIKASAKDGEDGVTPLMKIEDGNWMISYDKGKTWTAVGKATSEVIVESSLFKSVTQDSNNVYFVLADDSVITIPLVHKTVKLQMVLDETPLLKLKPGESASAPYEIIAPEGAVVSIETFEVGGLTVTVTPGEAGKGTLTVKAPEEERECKVMIVVTDDQGGSYVRVVKVSVSSAEPDPGPGPDPEPEPDPIEASYTVDGNGGGLIASYKVKELAIPSEDRSWVSIISLTNSVVLNVKANDTYESRTTVITAVTEDGVPLTITLTQLQNDAIVISEPLVKITKEEQTVPIVVKANVGYSVASDAEWLTEVPGTRALVEKTHNFMAEENAAGQRTATLTFTSTDGAVVQTVTVVQGPADGFEDLGMTITEIIAAEDGASVKTAESTVTALTKRGFVVSDGTKAIYAFVGSDGPTVSIGEKVKFAAKKTTYNGVPELTDITNVEVVSSGSASYPGPKDVTSTFDTYEASEAEFITFTGDLNISGSYYNITVEGAEAHVGSAVFPIDALGLADLSGHNITVTGYYNGLTGSGKYVNIIVTSVKDNGKITAKAYSVSELLALSVESGKDYPDNVALEESLVVAKSTKGFIVTDGSKYLYVFANKEEESVSVGDKITLTGVLTNYFGLYELKTLSDIVVKSSGNTVTHPSPVDITSQMDTFTGDGSSQYISVTGTMASVEATSSVTVNGAEKVLRVRYLLSGDALDTSLKGHTVKVTGYYLGLNTKNNTQDILFVSIEDLGGGEEPGPEDPGDGTYTITWAGAGDWTLVTGASGGATYTSGSYTIQALSNGNSNAPTVNASQNDFRSYAKNTVTVTSTKTMTKIVFNLSTQGLKRLAPITADVGTVATQALGDKTVTWTGSATSVTFTVGEKADYGSDGNSKAGQFDFDSIVITAN